MSDLGAALRGAIDDADALIVVCSPHAAQSPWVNAEVTHFKRSGRADRIFAVIIDGAPNALTSDKECFPPALRFEVDANGALTDRPAEPLALDTRRDTFSRLRARLVAGLLSIPFDHLWRRDKRRRMQSKVLLTGCVAAGAGAIALALLTWQNELQQSEIEPTLTSARVEAGEGRVAQAVSLLVPYLDGEMAGRVEPTLRTLLGWAQPASEQIAAMGKARVVSYRGALVFFDAQGGLHDISEIGIKPLRLILAQDRRRLVIIGEQRTFVVDAQTGARLADLNNANANWASFAFETPQGLLLVLGTSHGSTNGTIIHWALSVSKDGASASTNYISHMISIDGVWISGACQALVVTRDGDAIAFPFRASDVGEEVPYVVYSAAHPERVAQNIWQPDPQYNNNPFYEKWASTLATANPFVSAGCVGVAADDIAGDLDPSIVDLVKIGEEGGSGKWGAMQQIPMLYRERSAPDERGPFWEDATLNFNGIGVWRSLPVPRGIRPESTKFDVVDGRVLTFGEERTNAGVIWNVCGARCLEVAMMHNEASSYEVVRSPNGAHLLLAQAGAIVDLKRLELVTGLGELPTGAGRAFDFEPDTTQLAIVDGGEIVAYRPNAEGLWRRAALVALGSLGGSGDFAGLIALGGGHYIVAESNGQVSRVAPRGVVAWQIKYAGLGTVVGLRYSANRRYAALLSANGLRVIDTETGLVLSGILKPPGWTEDDVDYCQGGVHVGDDGNVHFFCMTYNDDEPRAAHWKPPLFEGTLESRLRAMLCGADERLSPIASLERCITH